MKRPRNRWVYLGVLNPPFDTESPNDAVKKVRDSRHRFDVTIAQVEALERVGKSVRVVVKHGTLTFYARRGGT